MDIQGFIKKYADQVGGQFTHYDSSKSIVVVPVAQGRFQTILVTLEKSPLSGLLKVVFSSKVAEVRDTLDLKTLLEESAKTEFARFAIEDGYVKVETSCAADMATEDAVKFIIQETANLADTFELKLTGKDIH